MNRSELVEALMKTTDFSKGDTEKWLSAFLRIIQENIQEKDGVRLVGFGTFTISERKSRKGRNPQTGKEITIPAKTVPVFRPGSLLKESVNKKQA